MPLRTAGRASPGTRSLIILEKARDARRVFPLVKAMESITKQLWQKARGGDPAAYDRLFALHADRAMLFIRGRLGPKMRSKVESGDVLQDAYLAAHQAFAGF